MRSILDKRGFQIGWTEMAYLIIGLLVVFLFINTFFLHIDIIGMVKSHLPNMHQNSEDKYGVISGEDEELPFIGGGEPIYVEKIDGTYANVAVYYTQSAIDNNYYLILSNCKGLDGKSWGGSESIALRKSNGRIGLFAGDKIIIGAISSSGQIFFVGNSQASKNLLDTLGWDGSGSKLIECSVRSLQKSFALVLNAMDRPAFYVDKSKTVFANIQTNLFIKDYDSLAKSVGL